MAEFVVATGLPPAVYWDTPRDETNAVVAAFNERNKKMNRKR